MQISPSATKVSLFVVLFAAAILIACAVDPGAKTAVAVESSAAAGAHRVVACYFHRTVRCPTCKKISAYIEEAVQSNFAEEVKQGRVAMAMIDFQDPKNQQYTNAYRITGPTLVVMDVHGEKVTQWKPAPKVWSLVGNKEAFLKYVQQEVRSYMEGQ